MSRLLLLGIVFLSLLWGCNKKKVFQEDLSKSNDLKIIIFKDPLKEASKNGVLKHTSILENDEVVYKILTDWNCKLISRKKASVKGKIPYYALNVYKGNKMISGFFLNQDLTLIMSDEEYCKDENEFLTGYIDSFNRVPVKRIEFEKLEDARAMLKSLENAKKGIVFPGPDGTSGWRKFDGFYVVRVAASYLKNKEAKGFSKVVQRDFSHNGKASIVYMRRDETSNEFKIKIKSDSLSYFPKQYKKEGGFQKFKDVWIEVYGLERNYIMNLADSLNINGIKNKNRVLD
jgi:hypothetical protein